MIDVEVPKVLALAGCPMASRGERLARVLEEAERLHRACVEG